MALWTHMRFFNSSFVRPAAALAAAALVATACGSGTGSNTPTAGAASVAPVVTGEPITTAVPATTVEAADSPVPGTATSADSVVVTTAAATTTTPVDPDADPQPDPDVEPEGVVPLEVLAPSSGVATPLPSTPFTRAPFDTIIAPIQVDPPPFEPVPLTADLDTVRPLGGLDFTAATGCGSHCISDAQITNVGGASTSYDLRVDLDVPATVEAFLTQSPISRNADGGYIPPSSVATATGDVGARWDTSFALDPETTYHLLVRATDEQGTSAVAGTFTTRPAIGPDALATPSPCADGCLTDISIEAADDGRSMRLEVGATVDTVIEMQWAPGTITSTEAGPVLDDPFSHTMTLDAGNRGALDAGGLTPYTAYSFIVIATDQFGSADRWVATVGTPSPPIYAGIDRVHVSGDGDDGNLNRGEMHFRYGTADGFWGYTWSGKTSSNTTLGLDDDADGVLEADGAGRYPWLAVVAGEQDGITFPTCFTQATFLGELDWLPETVEWCDSIRTMYSEAVVPSMTLAEIEQLQSCEWFDIHHTAADRCMWVHTAPNSSDQVSFEALVWFELDGPS